MGANNQPWPKEQEDELRRLYDLKQEDGYYLSHAYIVAMMQDTYPTVTRGAVIGKIRRLALQRDPTTPYIAANGVVIDPTVTNFTPKKYMNTDGFKHRKRVRVTAPMRAEAGEYTGTMTDNACSIAELETTNCHFPIGHVGHEGFHFCGAPVEGREGPYCVLHRSICYMPPKERVFKATPRWAIR